MAKRAPRDVQKLILDALERAPPRGYTFEEIAAKTGLSRTTVSKYIFGFQALKLVIIDKVGQSKLVRLARGE